MSLCRSTLISPSVNLLLTVILHLMKPHLCLSKKTCVSWSRCFLVSVAFFCKICYHSLEKYGVETILRVEKCARPKYP